jgi:hypothetical protein
LWKQALQRGRDAFSLKRGASSSSFISSSGSFVGEDGGGDSGGMAYLHMNKAPIESVTAGRFHKIVWWLWEWVWCGAMFVNLMNILGGWGVHYLGKSA